LAVFTIDEIVLLGPALVVGIALAWRYVDPARTPRLVWLSVALALLGGLTLVARPWHRWSGFTGASLVAIPVILGIQVVGRTLRSRPVRPNER
jgi:CHASE2 domain-containing sensor protein